MRICPRDSAEVFLFPFKATEGFVWEGSARRLGLGCSGEPGSPDVPFDQVTPAPSVLIIHRNGCDSTRAGVAELQTDLRTIQRPSQDHMHQMLRVTCLPALHRCQLGFLCLPYLPHPSSSFFLSPHRSPGVSSRSKPKGLKLLFFPNSLNYSHFHSLSCLCFRVHVCCILLHKFHFQSFSPSH